MSFFTKQHQPMITQRVLCCLHDQEDINEQSLTHISSLFHGIIQEARHKEKEIVLLCIGSDRSIGDALGPLVGTMLIEENVPYRVYGTLEHPVHAFNLEKTVKSIMKQLKDPLIISIDAEIGEKEQVGAVLLKEGPLMPGKALKKLLPVVGDYHMTGIVNYLDPLPATQFLNDTRLHTVMNLAKTIVKIIN